MQFSLCFAFLLQIFSVVTIQVSSCHSMIWMIQAQLPGFQIMGKICMKKTVWRGRPEASVSPSEYGWVMESCFYSGPTKFEFFWQSFCGSAEGRASARTVW